MIALACGGPRICWNVPQETDAEKIARLEREIERLKQEVERLRWQLKGAASRQAAGGAVLSPLSQSQYGRDELNLGITTLDRVICSERGDACR